jgi:opacity protein-like surface antigen
MKMVRLGARLAAVAFGLVLSTSPLYAQETRFTVTVSFANIHAEASTASPIIAAAPRGRSFEVTRELGSWVAIAWPAARDGVGYLHSSWGAFSRRDVADAPLKAAQPVAVQIDPQPGPLTPQPVSRVLLPSHIVGVGGRIGTQALSGFAAMGRLWFARHVGAQLELGRATHTNAAMLRMNVTDIGVNAITSLPDLVTNAVWMRPYVGGGMSIFRSSLRSTSGVSIATDTSRGFQAFGGAEFTWANVPQLAVSADLRHTWAAAPYGGFDTGGLGLALAAHWYMR